MLSSCQQTLGQSCPSRWAFSIQNAIAHHSSLVFNNHLCVPHWCHLSSPCRHLSCNSWSRHRHFFSGILPFLPRSPALHTSYWGQHAGYFFSPTLSLSCSIRRQLFLCLWDSAFPLLLNKTFCLCTYKFPSPKGLCFWNTTARKTGKAIFIFCYIPWGNAQKLLE